MLASAHRHAAFSWALLLLALACDNKSATKGGPAPSASVSAPAAGLTPELAARVLAKVGDKDITLGEFAATLDRMDPYERLRYQSADRRKQLLDELIDLQLLAEEAQRRGLDKQPETQERVRQMLRDELLTQVRASVPAPSDISDADARRYYDDHRDDFREPERRRVAHIQLASESEAKAVLEKAQGASPADWGKLVAEKSKDTRTKPSASLPPELAGDLGIVGPPGHPRGDNPSVPEPLRAAVFEIDKLGGVLPRVVAADGAFHVLRMTGKTDARDRSFADAQRAIRVALVQERIRQREAELEAELKQKYPVTIDETQLAKIPLPAASTKTPAPK
ncbi:MAG TPA: peptidyl-prolyl cis-trans isomerase [Polyangiaceae bacterium]|nr:peptidyl-prolyl cis-trans isomerase [Polyangiaceae bacterium]